MTRPHDRWTSAEIAQRTYTSGAWKHPPRKPVERRGPPGSGFGLAILLSVALWAIIGAMIFATRVL